MLIKQLGLIGCGLMGGSFSLTLKKKGLVKHVVGYSKSPRTTHAAKSLGVIDEEANSALSAASNSDVILLAVPVSATEDMLKAIKEVIKPDTLVMDVGSTKGDVVQSAQRAISEKINCFVPAHPIAGKEVFGVANADATLYESCNVILTPTEKTGVSQLQKAIRIWREMGAVIHQMSPEKHDALLAVTSHLPHALSYAFMQSAISEPNSKEKVLAFAGPSFRSMTRIAASDATMWRDIFLANRAEVLNQCRRLQDQFIHLVYLIDAGDGDKLLTWLNCISDARRKII